MTPANVIDLAERRVRRGAEQHQADRAEAQRRVATVRRVIAPNRVLTLPVPPPDDGPDRAA